MAVAAFDRSREFDVIIAGGGAAGCVLASRLSEESDKQVLLIEAGPDAAAPGAEHADLLNPFSLMASGNSAFHWPGLVAETGAAPADGSTRQAIHYTQGFGVGGSSNINGMGVDRGQPGDYDAWRDLGANGWGWNEVLPYFMKVERDLDLPDRSASPVHGSDGPVPVRRMPRARWAPFAASIGEALQRRGYRFIEDYLADFGEGFSSAPTNCLPNRRVSAPMGYLTSEVRSRPNLTILANTRVDRLSFDAKRANGVFIQNAGASRLVRGRRIVVSCGAIMSPALLMRSGVGPSAELARHAIPVVRDLPGVGAGLQNHPHIMLATYLPVEAIQPAGDPSFLQNWLRYSSNLPTSEPCDMHLMAFNKCDWHALGGRIGALAITVLQAFSRGRVALVSSNPATPPRVQFNLLDDSRDTERLMAGLRFALELLMDPAVAKVRHQIIVPDYMLAASLSRRNSWNRFKTWAITRVLDLAPLRARFLGKSRIDPEALLEDEKVLQDFVRRCAQPQYHPCGTCRMGRTEDPDAVVDGDGRVHGLEALRVVDASIFPTVPRGYTHFMVLMTAEKIADAIKRDWHKEQPAS